jgi:hypothetical protein
LYKQIHELNERLGNGVVVVVVVLLLLRKGLKQKENSGKQNIYLG